MRFDGADYQAPRDHDRLVRQYDKVFDLMSDRLWRSLKDISDATGVPEASASALLRDFRKERNGSHTVNRKYIDNGLYKYQLIIKEEDF